MALLLLGPAQAGTGVGWWGMPGFAETEQVVAGTGAEQRRGGGGLGPGQAGARGLVRPSLQKQRRHVQLPWHGWQHGSPSWRLQRAAWRPERKGTEKCE